MQITAQRKFSVTLTATEKTFLKTLIRKGTNKARTVTRARIPCHAKQKEHLPGNRAGCSLSRVRPLLTG